jgi:hypothetical protein
VSFDGTIAYPGIVRKCLQSYQKWLGANGDVITFGDDEYFGESVSISSAGTFVAIAGGPSARVYQYSVSDGWTQLGEDVKGNRYAHRISLSSDGKNIAAASGGVWVCYTYDKKIEKDQDYHSYSFDQVALSGDGTMVATSTQNAESTDLADFVIGYARVYSRKVSRWSTERLLTIGNKRESESTGQFLRKLSDRACTSRRMAPVLLLVLLEM